jgi:hypothetical protein
MESASSRIGLLFKKRDYVLIRKFLSFNDCSHLVDSIYALDKPNELSMRSGHLSQKSNIFLC